MCIRDRVMTAAHKDCCNCWYIWVMGEYIWSWQQLTRTDVTAGTSGSWVGRPTEYVSHNDNNNNNNNNRFTVSHNETINNGLRVVASDIWVKAATMLYAAVNKCMRNCCRAVEWAICLDEGGWTCQLSASRSQSDRLNSFNITDKMSLCV